MPNIGDIYKVKVFFKGTSGPYKVRPVLIVDEDSENGLFTIAELTSVEPKNPPGRFDAYKQKLEDWGSAGLDEETYVKCFKGNIHRVQDYRLFEFIGSVTSDDITNIFTKIIELNT